MLSQFTQLNVISGFSVHFPDSLNWLQNVVLHTERFHSGQPVTQGGTIIVSYLVFGNNVLTSLRSYTTRLCYSNKGQIFIPVTPSLSRSKRQYVDLQHVDLDLSSRLGSGHQKGDTIKTKRDEQVNVRWKIFLINEENL